MQQFPDTLIASERRKQRRKRNHKVRLGDEVAFDYMFQPYAHNKSSTNE